MKLSKKYPLKKEDKRFSKIIIDVELNHLDFIICKK